MSEACVLGIDFGTDSVRAVVVAAANGDILGVSVIPFPRWEKGLYCDPVADRYRQHPLDYLETMQASVVEALALAGPKVAARVRAIAVDTTGSTPVLADGRGRPLALSAELAEDPDAMFVLWKDHTAVAEAERINELARSWGGEDFTRYEGGVYSTEWFWSKVLHVVTTNPRVAAAAVTILEHCDWIPAVLTGTDDLARVRRSRCAAGHKAMWHAGWDGYPADAFLARLHPALPRLKATLGTATWTSDQPFGTLSAEWAHRLGLERDVLVAVGAFDAHMGAVGGGIRPHHLVKIMGTSTCDVMIGPRASGPEKLVPGICGQVDGSVIPGRIGYEAGQSAFGDVYAWFRKILSWPLETILADLAPSVAEAALERIVPDLERAAARIPIGESRLLALDWVNGRRTPDANQRLKGALTGIHLGTDAPRIFRALVEATAFGSLAIVERFRAEGIRIDGAIGIGGVAKKSPFVMQTVADVLDMSVEVAAGDQTVALGAAMFAATVAGVYPDVEEAQKAMSHGTERTYRPVPEHATHYRAVYRDYLALGGFVERELPQSSLP